MTKKTIWFTVFITFILFFIIHTDYASANDNNGKQQWGWPVNGELTDHFGTRGGSHYGIDIAAPYGTEITVVQDGTVVKSYFSGSYGNVVFVRHPDGYETVYAHMSRRLVQKGEKLKRGTVIGAVGNTGHSRGNHLHFEVHKGEWNIHKTMAVNPLVYIDQIGEQVAVNTETNTEVSDTNSHVIVVEDGDTLWELSKQYEVTVDELKEWNQLNTDLIVIGQKLKVSQPKNDKIVMTRGSKHVPEDKQIRDNNQTNQTEMQIAQGQGEEVQFTPFDRKNEELKSDEVAIVSEHPLPLIVDIVS
ncbi:peptidoglycan DD-metalloendopeptidase family protein [Alkalihalobacillus sp. AL-G]|uniref:peptidoglycan DD-metalloendopeptidase family protein n=1 Tax=Alkalihalobacillus sp. AL-G TaxID=2926399 RepID=UPI00272B988F|nr:peptidoglycan DD-metalloendopeptidase family protein [Alkalihalobacillus sp. AL-G]WLD91866.1 peptidoglycan DD-metalloendopeptidase family protein [Alkalihalobacillus sp. AL-G]